MNNFNSSRPRAGDILVAKQVDGLQVVLYDVDDINTGSLIFYYMQPGERVLVLGTGGEGINSNWTVMAGDKVWFLPVRVQTDTGWRGPSKDEWDIVSSVRE